MGYAKRRSVRHTALSPLSVMVRQSAHVLRAGAALFALCSGFSDTAWAQATCGAATSFTENFRTTTYQDPSTTSWGWGAGRVQLAQLSTLGSTTVSSSLRLPVSVTSIFTVSGRFRKNSANLDDLISATVGKTCDLVFENNLNMTAADRGGSAASTTASEDLPYDQRVLDSFSVKNQRLQNKAELPTGGNGCDDETILTAGDFDGDKDDDLILFNLSNIDRDGTVVTCYLYQNQGLASPSAVIPTFKVTSCLSTFNTTLFIHSRSAAVQAVDWDRDGRVDLLAGSSFDATNQVLLYKARSDAFGFNAPTVLIPNAGLQGPFASKTRIASVSNACPGPVSRGIGVVAAADLDGDKDLDVVVGGLSDAVLKMWIADARGVLRPGSDIIVPEGAAAFIGAEDFTGDGFVDLLIARRNQEKSGADSGSAYWNNTCGSVGPDAGGTAALYANDQRGGFSKTTLVSAYVPLNTDWMTKGKFDRDTRTDMIMGNSTGQTSKSTSVSYTPNVDGTPQFGQYGLAVSKPIDNVDTATYGIISVKIADVNIRRMDDNDKVDLFVSNDDGKHWEAITQEQLPPESVDHVFKTFGATLRWKAMMQAGKMGTFDGRDVALTWPTLSSITLEYQAVGPGEYSRSELAWGRVKVGANDERELILSASFQYPGFKGRLRALDITKLSKLTKVSTELERIDKNADVQLLWEAGEELRKTSGNARTFYTAFPAVDGGSPVNQLTLINESTINGPPSRYPNLQTAMGLDNNEKMKFWHFFYDGMNSADGTKMYDPGHSSPVFIAEATGDASYLGDSYDQFVTQTKARTPVVYLGDNSGMLHAFDARNGTEKWAFIPNNLLGKLRKQWDLTGTSNDSGNGHDREDDDDGDNGNSKATYLHDNFVDGTITIRDVLDSSTGSWRTILIGGQALGQGADDNNYYYAIDVTDPDRMKPLWQFTDPMIPPVRMCFDPTTGPSAECGGATGGMRCCTQYRNGVTEGEYYCAPVGSSCESVGPVMGETWSPPVVARIRVGGKSRWVVVFGSGYNNRNTINVGRTIYMVDAISGQQLGQWTLSEIPWFATGNPSSIYNTVPGGASVVDVDNDGYVDRIYVGDLEGRIWKLDTSKDVSVGSDGQLATSGNWPLCVLFDAGALGLGAGAGRRWAPIISTPAVAVLSPGTANVYFGTGGDDRAPSTESYGFYAVRDDDAAGTCRSAPKIDSSLDAGSLEWSLTAPAVNVGQRFWADPVIVSNRAVYFSSIAGHIEAVSPCLSGSQPSFLYGYAIRSFKTSTGTSYSAGQPILSKSALLSAGGLRRAVIARGASATGWTRPTGMTSATSSDIFVQEMAAGSDGSAPAVQRLMDIGAGQGNGHIRVIRWREIPL